MNGTNLREDAPLKERIAANPGPAALWLVGLLALVSLEFGALASTAMESLPWNALAERIGGLPAIGAAFLVVAEPLASFGDRLAELPTLLSRETIPNQGHRLPGGGWEGPFLGLAPAAAWTLRLGLVYLYATVTMAWLWKGYLTFRTHYRYAAWTPTDDVIDRLRRHRWGQFGIAIIFMFVVMALFAPAMGPTTIEQNIENPYGHQIEYLDDTDSVVETSVGTANLGSRSRGSGDENVAPLTYDSYDRWHPFGTLHNGKDLFTFMVFGARVSLAIGLLAMGITSVIAFALAMTSAYYKGAFDLTTVVLSDSVSAMPRLLVLIGAVVIFRETWIANVYDGGLLLALLFGSWSWPGLWRAIRGPSFQVVESEWIDAAKSYGQTPQKIMKKHMAPYVIGYMLIYASMSLGGIIIATSGLSFLGLGITEPTPEWGRAIAAGQPYVPTQSWHISILPGVLIVLVVTAFNALGDGIRDAIDPKSEGGDASVEASAAGGGA